MDQLSRKRRETALLWVFSGLLVALTFKQLRIMPFAGPVEISLGLLATYVFAFSRLQLRAPSLFTLLIVGLGGCAAMGAITSLWFQPAHFNLRDTIAYFFVAYICTAYFLLIDRIGHSPARVIGRLIGLYLVFALIFAWLPSTVQSYFWYYSVKFQGLSDNPNQIAFLAIIGSALLGLEELYERRTDTLAYIASGICAVAGILSDSSAYLLAACLVFSLILLLWLVNVASSVVRSQSLFEQFYSGRAPRTLLVVGILVAGTLGGQVLWPMVSAKMYSTLHSIDLSGWTNSASMGPKISDVGRRSPPWSSLTQTVEDSMKADQGQGSARIELWLAALNVIKQYPMFGLGPGPHVRTESIVPLTEAHNTFLDIITISGLIGAAFFIALLSVIIYNATISGTLWATALVLAGPLAFSMFHFTGRQPLLWLLLSFVYCAVIKSRTVRLR